MAYDNKLAQRIRKILTSQSGVTEREMFGGVGFMIHGNVACGVIGDEMMVRVGPALHQTVLQEPHVHPFAMTGKPAKGWIMVSAAALSTPASLKKWAQRGVEFALSLAPK